MIGLVNVWAFFKIRSSLRKLHSTNEDQRIEAIRVLSDHPTKAAISSLLAIIKTIKTDTDSVRFNAIETLSNYDDEFVTADLIRLLRDGNPSIRRAVVESLLSPHHCLKDRVEVALRVALRDPDASIRARAAFGLGFKGCPTSVPSLIVALRDSDANVKDAAVAALAMIGDERAVQALGNILRARSCSESAWDRACSALLELGQLPGPVDTPGRPLCHARSIVKPILFSARCGQRNILFGQ
jgi:HEAT repeat protein